MTDVSSETSFRVGLLTMRDARDPKSWSGTPYFISKALAGAGAQVDFVSPLDTPALRALRAVNKLRRGLGLKASLPNQSRFGARLMARETHTRLKDMDPDVLFSPAGSAVISLLETDLPLAYSSDATVRRVIGYYPEYSNISAGAIRQADALEQIAITRADVLIYPTRWVATSAIEDYGADPAKIHIQPYGANLANPPSREAALGPRAEGPLRLLFVGVSWPRKGGDIALAAHHALRARGLDSRLTVIGCTPPEGLDMAGVTVVPFLRKSDPTEAQQLARHYLDADLLVLPTRSECYGIVFCEASAYGLPSVTTATGGVPDVVTEGVNGSCLPLDADGPAYADRIEAMLADPAVFEILRRTSRDAYETRLNWQVWGRLAVAEFRNIAAVRA